MPFTSVIIKPLSTEKGISANASGKYIFLVQANSNKNEIKKTLEKLYGIKIKSIRTSIMSSKHRQVRGNRTIEKRPPYKKAIIQTKDKKSFDVNKFAKK